jgi:hypothetical protein
MSNVSLYIGIGDIKCMEIDEPNLIVAAASQLGKKVLYHC